MIGLNTKGLYRSYYVNKTLYISRPVTNADEIYNWCVENGIENIEPREEMHVTQMYCTDRVDWKKITPVLNYLLVTGTYRELIPLGNAGVVLKFQTPFMTSRYNDLKNIGIKSKHIGFIPHITLSYTAQSIKDIKPYSGDIELGMETFSEINI